jgi:hypothetical protein
LGTITGGHWSSVNEKDEFVEVDKRIEVQKQQLNASIDLYVKKHRNMLHGQNTNWETLWHWFNTPTRQDKQVQLSQNNVFDDCFTVKYTLFFKSCMRNVKLNWLLMRLKKYKKRFPN